ncbi:hypothetical protein EMPS_04481 [Entomortierella parvispora]|uniref:Uncharacterized protein n=1 Tax=Entomortierella parvispora TaxID=205924 RepID=A0A9P3H8R2_9FUNG|nr:hypothetical protein EMPS_04481 [Entomortierella parvispora]
MASSQRDHTDAPRHGLSDNEHDHSHHQEQDLANEWTDRTPSYSDIHQPSNGTAAIVPVAMPVAALHRGLLPSAAGQGRPAQTLTQTRQPRLLPLPTPVSTPSGLSARLELETDTVEIYDRSNDGFQYSLKGTIELEWSGQTELILKDARMDFMGYADTALLRYEAGATETPVHHTHDFIATPLVLSSPVLRPSSEPSGSHDAPPPPLPARTHHHKSLPIDLTLPGNLPESIHLAIGKIRYELQVTLELSYASGTRHAMTEPVLLRRPILIHRIVYPSAQLQPRVALGLDSGGVEIQVKVPRLLHCENTLLAVELHAKPRTRNVRLRRAKVVFEQIETDRYQRTSSLVVVPKAVVPLTANDSTLLRLPTAGTSDLSTSPPPPPHSPTLILPGSPAFPHVTGPPPAPRLLTRAIAQPLEVTFEEPTMEMQSQNMHLQLVLSPDLCVDVQSNWVQISHSLRVEIEYTTEEEAYTNAPPISQPPPPQLPPQLPARPSNASVPNRSDEDLQESESKEEETLSLEEQEEETGTAGIWDQEGDPIEQEEDTVDSNGHQDHIRTAMTPRETEHGNLHHELLDEKRALMALEEELLQAGHSDSPTLMLLDQTALEPDRKEGQGEMGGESNDDPPSIGEDSTRARSGSTSQQSHPGANLLKSTKSRTAHPSGASSSASAIYSVATEEIPIRVVRVVATALVDASTIAQAAGETEAGLPTYESVIEATGLPAYAEEKLEDDHEDAEVSGAATGVLGGAARRLEGDDAELQRR